VPALVAALKDPGEGIRRHVANVLGRLGPAAAEAVPALVAALKDPGKNFRWHVTGALVEIGPVAVPALVAAPKDPDDNIRWPKIWQGAVPALATANEDDDTVRQHFVFALGMIGPSAAEAVPALVAALKDPNKPVRRGAADALANIQGKSTP